MGLGPMEIVVILVVIVLLFGAKKIPELAKGLGEGVKEFKKAIGGLYKAGSIHITDKGIQIHL